jgi:hypothetical protein
VWIVIDIIALLFTTLNIKKWNRFKQNECIWFW